MLLSRSTTYDGGIRYTVASYAIPNRSSSLIATASNARHVETNRDTKSRIMAASY
jgi:hypothetical protein